MPENDLLLPPGSVLLHIGPPKTGTTTIQDALSQARAAMADEGVVYPGREHDHNLAVRAVLDTVPKAHPPGDPQAWDRLLEQVAAAGDRRVIVSSEFFSNADLPSACRIVEALGGPKIHVVVTVRPLAKVLPSSWQQSVRSHYLRASYEEWLDTVLGRPPYEDGPASFRSTYWQETRRQDVVVERWASVVGVENLTVVVVDESDPTVLTRVFEQLHGLTAGMLRAEKPTNTSLTLGEVELLRLLYEELHRRGWEVGEYGELVRTGPLRHLQRVDRPVEVSQRIRTPSWASDRTTEIGQATATGIAAAGVRVVGDLAVLGLRPESYEPTDPPEPVVASETAATAVIGAIRAAMSSTGSPGGRVGRRRVTEGAER